MQHDENLTSRSPYSQIPTLKGTARLYYRVPPNWVDAGLLGCIIGRTWKDVPMTKVRVLHSHLPPPPPGE